MKVGLFYTILVITSSQFIFAYSSFGQLPEQRMTRVSLRNQDLETLFVKLQEQTGLSFIIPGEVAKTKSINLQKADRTVKEVLDIVLYNTGLAYDFSENLVFIYEDTIRKTKAVDKSNLLSSLTLKVTGKVITASEKVSLPGVSIIVKGTNKGTTTDMDGEFVIEVEEKDILVFTSIGYKNLEIQVNGQTIIDVLMEEDVTSLNEVVINAGYYKTTDRTRTGNIVKVAAKEIETQPVTSPLMALQGRVPGLEISPNSGVPGSAPKILLRGRSSLRNDFLDDTKNGPLFIIDGVPIDPSPLRTASVVVTTNGFDPLAALNPANIESIEVLKDADATAIYGSRGANGVILITTKQATAKGKTNIDVSLYSGVGKIVNRMDVLNTQQYLQMRQEAFANDGESPGILDYDVNGTWGEERNTDWQEKLLGGKADIFDVSAGISGGSANTSFRLGGSYHKEGVIYSKGFGFQRATGNFSLNHFSENKRFNVSLTANYGANNNKLFQHGDFVTAALNLPPNAPALFDENGSLNWGIIEVGTSKVATFFNPLAKLRNTTDVVNGNLVVNGTLSYKLFSQFHIKTNIGFTELNSRETTKYPIAASAPTLILPNSTGSAIFANNYRKSWLAEPQLSYAVDYRQHSINAVIGASWQENVGEYKTITGSGYSSDLFLNSLRAARSVTIGSDLTSEYKYVAVFLRVGYDFKGKYLANITGRRDGSSRFGPNHKFGNFGAVGAAWVFSNENFVRDHVPVISFGKIRGSYGITGNDQIGDYKFYDTYSISQYPYQGMTSLSPTALFNPNFAWEATKKLEGAIELSLFKEKVFLEINRYVHTSSNQLIQYQLPATSGFNSVFSNFNATVENSGWESIIRFKIFRTLNFGWTTSLNISANRNRLVSFPDIENSSYANFYKVGESLSIQKRYDYKGISPLTGWYEVRDIKNDGILNAEDRQFSSPVDRKYYGGFDNTFSCGSFELSFLFQFSKQQKLAYMYAMPGYRNYNLPAEVLSRWRKPGDVTAIGKFTQNSANFSSFAQLTNSDYWIRDASFVRLKTLTVSYSLPPKILKSAKLHGARIYFQGQNLLTFTKYPGFDPETGTSLPPLKVLSGGLQLTF
ncbi:SusC/RagA family TonB-linked outer membrane protein [Fulvivirgaceae bacterium PWU4]|uniref:SusC/RagA family TonB-linked outer membrane protein n=1 Tax=Chryseosolibacter histidini TaxID=2782349 RepID=A0AAP2DUK4_9BACT|nr:SusC/RagA family TonB-linked outer membrane protein [Chryseosolibacter histidini]MBT1701507.1 SusC/RagA family TonB-linked outer membrane protein [Chryseosolibacter histidini]